MRKHFMFKVLFTLVIGLFLSVGAFAQQITVNGIVKDTTGEPVIGANVLVKGTTNGTITDFDGNFQLMANKGDIIVISFIGFTSQELPATTELMNVVLKDDSEMLSEVVVIGYGVAKKNDLTGSVTAMKPDEMNKGLVTNAQDMMQGKIAGVNVTSASGTPGAGATIRIRGGSSLNASNDPLIVIDGLAMDNNGVKGLSNPLSMVNPADIESFTVLKDASATAIYGSRGSNGVIIITTKKGRSGQKPSIAYNGNVSVSMKKKTIDVMNGQEFGEFIENMYGIGSPAWNALGKQYNLYGEIKTDANGQYLYNNTDWQDLIYREAVSHDHNVTISGGLKNMPYRVSLGYTNQQGILRTSDFERYTASVNLSPSLFDDHLRINLNAKGMIANTDYADTGAVNAAVWMDPTQSVNNYDSKYDNFDHYFQWLGSGAALKDPTWPYTYNSLATKNPMALLNQQKKGANSKSFVGNAEFDYKIHGFEDLRLHMNMGGDFSTGKETTYITPNSSTNAYYGWDGWDETDKYNLSFNAYAQYYKDLAKVHHFDIMAGYEWQHFHQKGEKDGWGWIPGTNTESPNSEYKRESKVWKTESYLVSFFGRANYSLLDRYLFTVTVRHDGSSRFKEHWATFPSFALGWKIKEEAFLKDVNWLSDLKLRLGYGQTGQQEKIGDYNYFVSYNVNTKEDSYYPLIGNGVLNRPNAYNLDLTWETTTTYNAGLDFGFLDNRITGSVDYYFRETTDLLNTVYVSAGTNFRNKVTSNIGSLENTGVEVSLNYKPIITEDFYWDLGLNVTYNKNEITELTGEKGYYVATGGISSGTGNTCQAHAVGYPASSFYVFQQAYDEKGMPLEGVYVDRNSDGQINQDDKYFYKSPTAPWIGGFTSKVMYKNWDLSFSLRGSFGNYVFNDLEAGTSNVSSSQIWAPSEYLSNRPKNVLAKGWVTYDNVLSDYFVQNASFLKCDNITLGYSFDNLFGVASGRVYGTVSNVFTITNYKGIDPEVNGGIDNSIYPRPFTALVGLNLNF